MPNLSRFDFDFDSDRDQTWVDMHDKKAIKFMQGWWGGQDDPLYAIASSNGNYAWVFEDAIANLDADIAKVKKSGKKFKLGKGTFTKAEIDELHYIRNALASALEGVRGGDMDEFTMAYFETALWSSTDELDPETGGEPLDANYGIEDFAPETRKEMIADAKDFQKRFGHLIESAEPKTVDYNKWERAGHDFWLTRNGHGAGFWDGDWPEPQATELTNAAHSYGECSLNVGDDGLIYGYGCGRPPRGAREAQEARRRPRAMPPLWNPKAPPGSVLIDPNPRARKPYLVIPPGQTEPVRFEHRWDAEAYASLASSPHEARYEVPRSPPRQHVAPRAPRSDRRLPPPPRRRRPAPRRRR